MARSGLNSLRARLAATVVAAAGLAIFVAPASAQVAPDVIRNEISTGNPQRDTLLKMLKPISISFDEQPLEAIVDFITQYTGAEIRTLWADDAGGRIGLDREARISITVREVTTLELLEQVLQEATGDFGDIDDNTWQMTRTGTLMIGPKERLNGYRRIELYDINDLLLIIPDYDNAPEFDLSQVTQNSGGGGGGGGGGSSSSPFQGSNDNDDEERATKEERADDLIDLIQNTVELDNWDTIAPNGATIRYYQGNLIINGPDYMHRAVSGYGWWPQELTNFAGAGAPTARIGFMLDEDTKHKLGYDITPEVIVLGTPSTSPAPTVGG